MNAAAKKANRAERDAAWGKVVELRKTLANDDPQVTALYELVSDLDLAYKPRRKSRKVHPYAWSFIGKPTLDDRMAERDAKAKS